MVFCGTCLIVTTGYVSSDLGCWLSCHHFELKLSSNQSDSSLPPPFLHGTRVSAAAVLCFAGWLVRLLTLSLMRCLQVFNVTSPHLSSYFCKSCLQFGHLRFLCVFLSHIYMGLSPVPRVLYPAAFARAHPFSALTPAPGLTPGRTLLSVTQSCRSAWFLSLFLHGR